MFGLIRFSTALAKLSEGLERLASLAHGAADTIESRCIEVPALPVDEVQTAAIPSSRDTTPTTNGSGKRQTAGRSRG